MVDPTKFPIKFSTKETLCASSRGVPRARFEVSNRRDGLGPGFGHEHDRAALIAKRPAQFADEILCVGLGKQFVTIDEEQKRGGRLFHLRRIEKLEPMARRADGLAAFDGVVERAIE